MSSQSSADEIRVRICGALEYDGDDWLERACLALQAHRNQMRACRAYDLSTIGGRLRCARECAGMLQRNLARRVGMTQYAISNMELERLAMPATKLAGICQALGVSQDWMLMLSDEGGPKARHGILRSVQTPGQAKQAARERRQAEGMELVRARRLARKALTLPVNSQQSCPTTELPTQDTAQREEAAKPPC